MERETGYMASRKMIYDAMTAKPALVLKHFSFLRNRNIHQKKGRDKGGFIFLFKSLRDSIFAKSLEIHMKTARLAPAERED